MESEKHMGMIILNAAYIHTIYNMRTGRHMGIITLRATHLTLETWVFILIKGLITKQHEKHIMTTLFGMEGLW